MHHQLLEDLPIQKGDRVLVRADLNVPILSGKVQINKRILGILPTLDYLHSLGAKIIILSHLGRPELKKDGEINEEFSMFPIAEYLNEIYKYKITYIADCRGKLVQDKIATMKEEEILLLENVRFYSGEINNDKVFAAELAENIDIYVNEAFGVSHRVHASVHGITQFVPHSGIGYMFQDEIDKLNLTYGNVQRPFMLISGGLKIKDKIPFIYSLEEKTDKLLLGGAMVCTFLKAMGLEVGDSPVSDEHLDEVRELLNRNQKEKKILLPIDFIIAKEIDFENFKLKDARTVDYDKIPIGYSVVDIGPKTVQAYCKELEQAKTCFWNGPLGIIEIEEASHGTVELTKYLSTLNKKNVTTIIGGGNSASVIEKLKLGKEFTHISTGGGASMYYIENNSLPCLEILSQQTATNTLDQ